MAQATGPRRGRLSARSFRGRLPSPDRLVVHVPSGAYEVSDSLKCERCHPWRRSPHRPGPPSSRWGDQRSSHRSLKERCSSRSCSFLLSLRAAADDGGGRSSPSNSPALSSGRISSCHSAVSPCQIADEGEGDSFSEAPPFLRAKKSFSGIRVEESACRDRPNRSPSGEEERFVVHSSLCSTPAAIADGSEKGPSLRENEDSPDPSWKPSWALLRILMRAKAFPKKKLASAPSPTGVEAKSNSTPSASTGLPEASNVFEKKTTQTPKARRPLSSSDRVSPLSRKGKVSVEGEGKLFLKNMRRLRLKPRRLGQLEETRERKASNADCQEDRSCQQDGVEIRAAAEGGEWRLARRDEAKACSISRTLEASHVASQTGGSSPDGLSFFASESSGCLPSSSNLAGEAGCEATERDAASAALRRAEALALPSPRPLAFSARQSASEVFGYSAQEEAELRADALAAATLETLLRRRLCKLTDKQEGASCVQEARSEKKAFLEPCLKDAPRKGDFEKGVGDAAASDSGEKFDLSYNKLLSKTLCKSRLPSDTPRETPRGVSVSDAKRETNFEEGLPEQKLRESVAGEEGGGCEAALIGDSQKGVSVEGRQKPFSECVTEPFGAGQLREASEGGRATTRSKSLPLHLSAFRRKVNVQRLRELHDYARLRREKLEETRKKREEEEILRLRLEAMRLKPRPAPPRRKLLPPISGRSASAKSSSLRGDDEEVPAKSTPPKTAPSTSAEAGRSRLLKSGFPEADFAAVKCYTALERQNALLKQLLVLQLKKEKAGKEKAVSPKSHSCSRLSEESSPCVDFEFPGAERRRECSGISWDRRRPESTGERIPCRSRASSEEAKAAVSSLKGFHTTAEKRLSARTRTSSLVAKSVAPAAAAAPPVHPRVPLRERVSLPSRQNFTPKRGGPSLQRLSASSVLLSDGREAFASSVRNNAREKAAASGGAVLQGKEFSEELRPSSRLEWRRPSAAVAAQPKLGAASRVSPFPAGSLAAKSRRLSVIEGLDKLSPRGGRLLSPKAFEQTRTKSANGRGSERASSASSWVSRQPRQSGGRERPPPFLCGGVSTSHHISTLHLKGRLSCPSPQREGPPPLTAAAVSAQTPTTSTSGSQRTKRLPYRASSGASLSAQSLGLSLAKVELRRRGGREGRGSFSERDREVGARVCADRPQLARERRASASSSLTALEVAAAVACEAAVDAEVDAGVAEAWAAEAEAFALIEALEKKLNGGVWTIPRKPSPRLETLETAASLLDSPLSIDEADFFEAAAASCLAGNFALP